MEKLTDLDCLIEVRVQNRDPNVYNNSNVILITTVNHSDSLEWCISHLPFEMSLSDNLIMNKYKIDGITLIMCSVPMLHNCKWSYLK